MRTLTKTRLTEDPPNPQKFKELVTNFLKICDWFGLKPHFLDDSQGCFRQMIEDYFIDGRSLDDISLKYGYSRRNIVSILRSAVCEIISYSSLEFFRKVPMPLGVKSFFLTHELYSMIDVLVSLKSGQLEQSITTSQQRAWVKMVLIHIDFVFCGGNKLAKLI